jgi:hypothetical protein
LTWPPFQGRGFGVWRFNSPGHRTAQSRTGAVFRENFSVRIFTRRFTHCTLGVSKKLENLKYAVALFVWHFNFVRVHSAHGKTPAEMAGLTDKPMTIKNFLSLQMAQWHNLMEHHPYFAWLLQPLDIMTVIA